MRNVCSSRFNCSTSMGAALAAQRYPHASALGALQARAIPSAPRMLYATPTPKLTWLRH